ncbi:trehalase 1 [Wolffia australiana]
MANSSIKARKIAGNGVFILYTAVNLVFAASAMASHHTTPSTPLIEFLQRTQSAVLQSLGPKNFDPKLYVDLPLRRDLNDAKAALDAIQRPGKSVSPSDLRKFLGEYFGPADGDLRYAVPSDFVPEPKGFLPKVEHARVRDWAVEVHSLWKNLSRRVSDDVRFRPDLRTLLPLPDQIVIPGSRFREVYYWDTYWIIRGLLASKMYETAKAVAKNLLFLVEKYGFVPNGSRAYYTNRSQPPLLSSMIMEIYRKTGDLMFVKKSLPYLLKEHKFWGSEIHELKIRDSRGHIHKVNRYYAMWNKPRPESGTTDVASAAGIPDGPEKEAFYREVASTAESGWDFSTRWMSDASDFKTLMTTSIIPVDLNAYILKMESDIAFFSELVGDVSTAKKFSESSLSRRETLKMLFWNDEMGQWLDYRLAQGGQYEKWAATNQNQNIFASNFIPLWIASESDHSMVKKAVQSLRSSGLLHPYGIATSLTDSGQQWDFPNGWAPLQHLIVEGLARSGIKDAQDLAEDIASRWIRTNFVSYQRSGVMHEKYDVTTCGGFGGGGEYSPQTGFGWSNGVVLAFLEEFGWPRNREIGC